jgi:hypothetical protein
MLLNIEIKIGHIIIGIKTYEEAKLLNLEIENISLNAFLSFLFKYVINDSNFFLRKQK